MYHTITMMTDNNQHIDFEELVARYLAGSATSEEADLLEHWVKSDKEKRTLFLEIRKSWRLISTAGQQYDAQKAWDTITLHTKEKTTTDKIKPLHATSSAWTPWRMAAAIAVLLACLFSVFYFTQLRDKTLVAEQQPANLQLHDGSMVSINKGSTLSYPVHFGGNERRVKLEGEAYFEVQPDPLKVFVVEVQGIEVRVLGTSFYVKAHSDDARIEVTVSSGKVAMITPDNRQLPLSAGQKATYHREEKAFSETTISNPNFLAWRTRKMIFEYSPLNEVFEVIGHTYGIDIRLRNPQLENCLLTATFNQQSLQDVLTIVGETFGLRFSRDKEDEDTIWVSGEGCEQINHSEI